MQLALSLAGGVLGNMIAPGIGGVLGSMAGSLIGGLLSPTPKSGQTPPQLSDAMVGDATPGAAIARVWGVVGVATNCIWENPPQVIQQESGGKGLGSKSSGKTQIIGSFACGICQGPVEAIGRIWANGNLIRDAAGGGKYAQYFTFYLGTETQLPDPTIEAHLGAGEVPAFRGLCYLVATNLPLDDFGGTIPNLKVEVSNPGPNGGDSLNFDSAFLAKNTTSITAPIGQVWNNYGLTPDAAGNQYLTDASNIGDQFTTQAYAFSRAGAMIWSLSYSQAADMVDAFNGSPIVGRDGSNHPLLVAPILNGKYIFMAFSANGYSSRSFYYCCILAPSSTGLPQMLGFVRILVSALEEPNGIVPRVSVAGLQTESDTILLETDFSITNNKAILLCPCVTDIVQQKFLAGYGAVSGNIAVWEAYEVPHIALRPFASSDFSWGFTSAFDNSSGHNVQGGFPVPTVDLSSGGGVPIIHTVFYVYLNRGIIEANTGAHNPEIQTVLAPAYPDGCVVKVDLGAIDFYLLALADIGPGTSVKTLDLPTAGYTVANADFFDGVTPAIPFLDEYHYLSSGAAGGNDCYGTRPALYRMPSGAYLVLFSMVGIDDRGVNGTGYTWISVRAFIYDPRIDPIHGIAPSFTQFASDRGIIFAPGDISVGMPSFGSAPDSGYTLYWDGSTEIDAWGSHLGGFGQPFTSVYLTKIGEVALQGYSALGDIINDISDAVGLDHTVDVDVSACAGIKVPGYVVARESDGRRALEGVINAYQVDGIEEDGKVKFKPRRGITSSLTVNEDHLGARSSGQPAQKFKETRKREIELPLRVIVRYLDNFWDYQQNAQQSPRMASAVLARGITSYDFAIVLTADDAKQIAERMRDEAWATRSSGQWTLPLPYFPLSATDGVTLQITNIDGLVSSELFYLTQADLGADLVLSFAGVTVDSAVYEPSSAAGAQGAGPGDETRSYLQPVLQIMDLPPLSDSDDDFGFYWAWAPQLNAASIGGAVLYRDGGSGLVKPIDSGTVATPMGTASTVLAAGPVDVHDDVNSVMVALNYGTLSNCTRAQSLNYINLALLGNEILTFETADLIAPGVYRLSNLKRGMKGTEVNVGAHVPGERFVLLDSVGVQRVTDLALNRGIAINYKAVAFGLSVDSAADVAFTDTGASLKPYSPVAIAGARDGSNNLAVTWIRRARLYAEWSDGTDVPLDEPSEQYEVDIVVSGVVKRTITATASANGSLVTPTAETCLYKAADQTLDGITPGNPVALNVYQISARIGRGFPGNATI